MKWDYLSEEELERLMADTEMEGLLPAPEYLASMILQRAGRECKKKESARRQLLLYSIKIMAAAAASVAILFAVPPSMTKEEIIEYRNASMQEEQERVRDRTEAYMEAGRRLDLAQRLGLERQPGETGQKEENVSVLERITGRVNEQLNGWGIHIGIERNNISE